MPEAAPIGVGLLGLGVVGSGVAQALATHAVMYAQRTGRSIELRRIAVRDPQRQRAAEIGEIPLVTDPLAVVEAEDVHVVVELMGGEQPAADCIRAALSVGKPVVTANKEVMAKHGPALLELAYQQGVELLYEAAVGGGIPIIAPLKRDLQANEIRGIRAIINGTTNYILTAMAQDGVSYDAALAEAQRLGYAEADPSSDVDGIDAAYKLAILASLAFHARISPDDVYREGIRDLTARDFRYAADLGYVIRLLAIAGKENGEIEARVHPVLVPASDPIGRVDGVLNAVAVEGDLLGQAIFEGPGAGSEPTTSAVIADLLDLVHGLAAGQQPRPLRHSDPSPRLRPMASLSSRVFLRLLVQDRPGGLAEMGGIFAEHNISIASLLQVSRETEADGEGAAELIVTTHVANEGDVNRCLQALAESSGVIEVGVRLRIEDPR